MYLYLVQFLGMLHCWLQRYYARLIWDDKMSVEVTPVIDLDSISFMCKIKVPQNEGVPLYFATCLVNSL